MTRDVRLLQLLKQLRHRVGKNSTAQQNTTQRGLGITRTTALTPEPQVSMCTVAALATAHVS